MIIDYLTSDVMVLEGNESLKQMATIFDQMLETKEKKKKEKSVLLHKT